MGGQQFSVTREAWTAEEAFRQAHEDALYDHGHGGYSGTIAEKTSFRLRTPPTLDTKIDAWRAWYDKLDDAHDKWGSAECVVLREPETPRRLTKAQALKLARERFGETAEVVLLERSRGAVRVAVYAVADKASMGCNERLPNGKWRAVVASAQGKDADDARGRLFAKKGLYLFFGWASS